MTKIPWTDETWNPVIGCTKVAEGCKNCYARRLHNQRHKAYMNNKKIPVQYAYPFHIIQILDDRPSSYQNRLVWPLHWRNPRMIFVCSMGDLFHPKVPESYIYQVLLMTQQANWHIYQILTKQVGRAAFVLGKFYGTSDGQKWPFENVWLGTSISTQADADKNIPLLLQIPAAIHFVSLEPMLELIDLASPYTSELYQKLTKNEYEFDLPGIDWVIIGCESGPKARLCSLDDIDYAIEQCREANVPVFLKQIPLNGKCVKKPERWPVKYRDKKLRQYPN